MNIQEQEERDFEVATDSDWDRAEARELGAADPDQAWVLTDRDVWHANPFYQGPPVPHPEDDYAWEEDFDVRHYESEDDAADFDPDAASAEEVRELLDKKALEADEDIPF
mgnify:FL=1